MIRLIMHGNFEVRYSWKSLKVSEKLFAVFSFTSPLEIYKYIMELGLFVSTRIGFQQHHRPFYLPNFQCLRIENTTQISESCARSENRISDSPFLQTHQGIGDSRYFQLTSVESNGHFLGPAGGWWFPTPFFSMFVGVGWLLDITPIITNGMDRIGSFQAIPEFFGNKNQVEPLMWMIWVWPPPSNSGKWRFIGIPYWKCNNPGGHCYWEGATPNGWFTTEGHS